MKTPLRILMHAGIVLCVLLLLVGIPAAVFFDVFGGDGTDAVSSATIVVDAPSGSFYVLLNPSLHEDALEDWVAFLSADPDSNEDLPIIWEDAKLLYAEGDATGEQLAERYQSMLSPNQMTIRSENPTLLCSKVENGLVDIAVFSREFADALQLNPEISGLTVMELVGGE